MTRVLAPLAPLLAAALLALVPTAALAQDAGCAQYCDPLAEQPHTPGNTPTPTASSSPAPVPSTTQGGQTATAQGSTLATTAQPGIPRTGFPVGWLLFTGALILGGGLALRRAAGSASA